MCNLLPLGRDQSKDAAEPQRDSLSGNATPNALADAETGTCI